MSENRCATCDQPLPGAAPALPASLVAAARLDDASLVLLAFAYLTGALALATGLAPLVAGQLAFEWKVLAALAGGLAASVLFVSLKYASEAMRSLADVARTASRVEQRLDQALRSPGPGEGHGAARHVADSAGPSQVQSASPRSVAPGGGLA